MFGNYSVNESVLGSSRDKVGENLVGVEGSLLGRNKGSLGKLVLVYGDFRSLLSNEMLFPCVNLDLGLNLPLSHGLGVSFLGQLHGGSSSLNSAIEKGDELGLFTLGVGNALLGGSCSRS